MILKAIVDEIKADIQAGVTIDDSRLDDAYIAAKVHAARAIVIENYLRTRINFVSEACTQTLDFRFLEKDLDAEVVSFDCPSVITADISSDGFVYVGRIDGMKPFKRNRLGYFTLGQHSYYKNSNNIFWDFSVNAQGYEKLNFYKNKRLEGARVKAMFNNPLDVPGFRVDVDNYPVDQNVKSGIVEMVTLDMFKKLRGEPDRVSDGNDKPLPPNK